MQEGTLDDETQPLVVNLPVAPLFPAIPAAAPVGQAPRVTGDACSTSLVCLVIGGAMGVFGILGVIVYYGCLL